MSEFVALNLDQTLELIKEYIKAHNLSNEHINQILNIVYSVCSPDRKYQPHQLLYDRDVVLETLAKIKLE